MKWNRLFDCCADRAVHAPQRDAAAGGCVAGVELSRVRRLSARLALHDRLGVVHIGRHGGAQRHGLPRGAPRQRTQQDRPAQQVL